MDLYDEGDRADVQRCIRRQYRYGELRLRYSTPMGSIRTVVCRDSSEDPTSSFVNHNVPHAVLFPPVQYSDHLFTSSHTRDLEAYCCDCGSDTQESLKPVLMSGTDWAKRRVRVRVAVVHTVVA